MIKNFTFRNTRVYYKISGEGTAVVLLHGFAESGNIWDAQLNFLADKNMVIVPDLPGTGKSGLLKQDDQVNITDYADCVVALLQHEQVSSCIMIGHSMGGYITYALAMAHAGLLKGFGVVHSTAFADTEDKKATRQKSIDSIKQYGPQAFLKTSIPTLFGDTFQRRHPDVVNGLVESGKTFSGDALVQYTTAMMNRPERTEVLRSSEVPVLFILGTDDVAAPLNDVLQQVHLPRVSYIHILQDVGHMSMLEATEPLNNHLLDFIRACEPE
ncbi:alpha/beta hydrolase [Segetibacter sp. 3557_3]|uniref:alpha/beta fold hydrolase n=1 Tax=Segetibacter sp. 3557_3 TaxID=2547429 RepID=UPI001058C3CC|nr:alpha/beta hydrolase [Segetibacter sp. 3557_3]TDH21244.1 alpha/beta hydrolase [Segetibacter sp. 3557_3]